MSDEQRWSVADPTNWQTSAACAAADPDLFRSFTEGEMNKFGGHPNQHPRVQQAFRVCAGCPVRSACFEYAVARRETGVWGGQYLSERTADSVKRRRKKAAA